MKIHSFIVAVIAIIAYGTLTAQDSSVAESRTALQEWVETRQIISREKADWALLKEVLADSEELLAAQLGLLTEKLAELEDSQTAADEEREKLMASNEALKEATRSLDKTISAVEVKLLALVPSFPQPLRDGVDPLVRRIPRPGTESKASLGERVQNIVGILSQADRFNSRITLVNRTQQLKDGREVQVSTLFWGLGQAYFVDTTGTYAGVGLPTPEGWVFEEVSGLAPSVAELIRVYRGESNQINFVAVPARVR